MGQISAVAGINAYSTQNLSLSLTHTHTHTHKHTHTQITSLLKDGATVCLAVGCILPQYYRLPRVPVGSHFLETFKTHLDVYLRDPI